ncbi:MAG: hypothetical protein ABFD81_09030 [Syntrophaceae bacterium]
MVVLATLCLVVMAVAAGEAALSARNIIVIIGKLLRSEDLPEIQPHQG